MPKKTRPGMALLKRRVETVTNYILDNIPTIIAGRGAYWKNDPAIYKADPALHLIHAEAMPAVRKLIGKSVAKHQGKLRQEVAAANSEPITRLGQNGHGIFRGKGDYWGFDKKQSSGEKGGTLVTGKEKNQSRAEDPLKKLGGGGVIHRFADWVRDDVAGGVKKAVSSAAGKVGKKFGDFKSGVGDKIGEMKIPLGAALATFGVTGSVPRAILAGTGAHLGMKAGRAAMEAGREAAERYGSVDFPQMNPRHSADVLYTDPATGTSYTQGDFF